MKKSKELFLRRCLELAENGLGTTYPNPLVGAVIVHNDNIIGEGWHYKKGEPHAEVMAVNSVKDQSLLSKSEIYVSLEPCSHHGSTPPCVDLILKHKIPKVFIGIKDPFDKVNGRGIERLKSNGVEVEYGFLEDEFNFQNRRFLTFHTQKRPFVILKWAETKDGFIAPKESKNGISWITNEYTQQLTHLWRSQEEAILIGSQTLKNDNPSLTTRAINGKNPIRILIHEDLSLGFDYKLFDNSSKTIVFNGVRNDLVKENLELIQIDFKKNVNQQILEVLYQKGIQSLIIEGGAKTLQSFIDQNLWDEARVLMGNKYFYEGVKSPDLKAAKVIEERKLIGGDVLSVVFNVLEYE